MKIVTIFISLYLGYNSTCIAVSTAHKLMVVANVEDTLKVAHSQNFWDSLNYVHDSESRFLGMNGVLKLLLDHNPSTSLIYLLEPQELLAGPVQLEFLKKNDFPRGYSISYRKNSDFESRLDILRNAVQVIKPTRVVLIGHNGGVDIEAYQTLSREFPEIIFHQYIHILYSPNSESEVGKFLSPSQRGYITAIELLLDLRQNNLVDWENSLDFSMRLQDQVLSEEGPVAVKEIAIPSFARCDSFLWTWEISGELSFFTPLKDYLSNRCYSQLFYAN